MNTSELSPLEIARQQKADLQKDYLNSVKKIEKMVLRNELSENEAFEWIVREFDCFLHEYNKVDPTYHQMIIVKPVPFADSRFSVN